MRRGRILLALLAGVACSGSEEPAPPGEPDPAAQRARCNAEVIDLCSGFQRAEQLECVRREVERCIRGSREPR